ncbi:MAG: hypothetical protein HXY53_00840 [Nitrospirae bacterium]|nr:hypothetical protein [Nitrospirota bacterium]
MHFISGAPVRNKIEPRLIAIIEVLSRITKLVNKRLIKEEQLGRMFSVETGPTFNDASKIYQKDLEEAQPVIERLVDLFLRINTTRQAELASTVHFAAQSLQKNMIENPQK